MKISTFACFRLGDTTKTFQDQAVNFWSGIGVEERNPVLDVQFVKFVSLVGLNFHYFGIRFVSC